MKLNVLLGLLIVGIGLLIYNLVKNNKSKKEIITIMGEQETRLGEQITGLETKIGNIQTGVDSLQATQLQMAEEIRVLRENNPDLEDEIARLESLNSQAGAVLTDIAGELPPVEPETPAEVPTEPEAPTEETPGEVEGEMPFDTVADASEADTGELPGDNAGNVSEETPNGGTF